MDEPDYIESLFFALKMNYVTYHKQGTDDFDRYLAVTRKAWIRHWKRIQTAIDRGNNILTIPNGYLDNEGRFCERLVP